MIGQILIVCFKFAYCNITIVLIFALCQTEFLDKLCGSEKRDGLPGREMHILCHGICTLPSCFIPVNQNCFLLNRTTRFLSLYTEIMDVTIIIIDYMSTCLAGTGQLLITSSLAKQGAYSEET